MNLRRQIMPGMILFVVAVGVLGPFGFVVGRSLFQDGSLTLSIYAELFQDERFRSAMLNSLVYVGVSVPIAVGIGLALALTASRLRGRVIRLLPLISLLIPPLLGAMGWVFLLSPRVGLINIALRALFSLDTPSGPFDIYTLPGVLFASVVYSVPYTYLYCVSALENLDPALEEAARSAGASTWATLRTVVIPVIRPGLSSAVLLTTLVAFAEFSVPLIIGRPFGFWVLTMEIWNAARGQFPSDYASATAMGSLLLVIVFIGLALQRYVLSKGQFVTVSGKGKRPRAPFSGSAHRLGTAAVWLYVLVTVGLPVIAIAFVSLQQYWTPSPGLETLSFSNYTDVLKDGRAVGALSNSGILAVVAATAAVILTAVGAYITVRLKGRVGALLDYATMLPSGVPHTVLGLGFLLFFIYGPLPIYGTVIAIALAYVVLYLPYASRSSIGAMHQLAPELEEASYISGATWTKTMRKITMPLLMPGLRAGWVLVFILAFREFSTSIFLVTGQQQVVSTFLVDLWENALIPVVAALAMIVVAISAIIVYAVNRRRPIDQVG